jgi:acetyl esterase/lipase
MVLCTLAFAAFGQPAQEVTVEKDVVYGHSGGVDLKLDLARPPLGNGPVPALVCIHGGAWQMGDKSAYEPVIRQLAAHGYVAAAVGYRLAPVHKWPAQVEDVKCAVRYLRAHAKDLNIDPAKMGAVGDSAGGHLSLLLGLMDPKDGMEGTGGNPEQSSKVQAVANFYGPADFRVWHVAPEVDADIQKNSGKRSDDWLVDFLGTSDRAAPVMIQVSPVAYINAGDPPILTFHGTADQLVPIEQAKILHAALEKAGVTQQLVVMEGAGHGFNPVSLTSALQQGLEFFDVHLKNAKPETKQAAPEHKKSGAAK